MNAKTKAILENMKRAGIDISNIETQLNSNSVAEENFVQRINSDPVFKSFQTNQESSDLEIKNNAQRLAHLHDSISIMNIDENHPLYEEYTTEINNLETKLVSRGFDEKEVKELSFVSQSNLTKDNSNNLNPNINNENEDEDMAKFDPKKHNVVTNDDFNTQLANSIEGTILTDGQFYNQVRRYERIYGDKADDNKIENFRTEYLKSFRSGETKDINSFADKYFEISKRQGEIQNEQVEQRVKEAKEEGKREALKSNLEIPSRRTQLNIRHQILDRQNPNRNRQVELKKNDDGTTDLPTNSVGDVEIFRSRGDKFSRVNKASDFFNEKVLPKVDEYEMGAD